MSQTQGNLFPSTQLFARVTNPQVGDMLTWDVNTSEWINEALTAFLDVIHDGSLQGQGNTSSPLGLTVQTNVAGTYTNQQMTLNNRGVVTGITAGLGTITPDGLSIFGTGSTASNLHLQNYGVAGTYVNTGLIFNNYGLLTSTTNGATVSGIAVQTQSQSIANGGVQPISWLSLNTTTYHSQPSMTNASTNLNAATIQVSQAGLYEISITGAYDTNATGTNRGVRITQTIPSVVTNNVIAANYLPPNSVNGVFPSTSISVLLNANDSIAFQAFNDATASVNATFTCSMARVLS